MGLRTLAVSTAILIIAGFGGHARGEEAPAKPGRAIVTALTGKAMAGQRRLSDFSVCYAGDSIAVAAEAQLTLVLTQPLHEYVVTGPARFRLTPDGLVMETGNAPRQRDLFPGRALQLQDGLIEQASTRTRGEGVSTPFRDLQPNGTLVEPTPAFNWTTALPGPVTLTLYDAQAAVVYRQAKVEPGFRLPDAVTLRARQHYTWTLTGRRADGRGVRAQGNFIVADAAQLTWRAQLGDCAQSVSKQVACALLLEQAGFRGEAQRYWNALPQTAPNHRLIRAYQTLGP